MVKVRELGLAGVRELIPEKFNDSRGFVSESYNARCLSAQGIMLDFVQDNHSFSNAVGVLRGLHYQLLPFGQEKLVRVTSGRIFDVVVDIRRGSPTFSAWVALELSAERWNQLLVPCGYAHGFLTLEPNTEVLYKITEHYFPEHARSIRYDDPEIGIDWPLPKERIILSDKDCVAPLLADADVFDYAE